MIKVTFLGTGTSQGVPMIGCKCEVCQSKDPKDKRLRSSVIVQTDNLSLVIDAGPDFRYQMLRSQTDSIDAVLLTHEHKDHTGGLDDVRAFNYILKRPIDVYGSQKAIETIRKDYDYAFGEKKYPGVPEIITHTLTGNPFNIGNQQIVPIKGKHFKAEVFGYRIGAFCYLTDMNFIETTEIEKIKNVDVLVINALRHEKHISHFTLQQALAVIEQVAPKRAFLTHLSHQMGCHNTLEHLLPSNVFFAYDTLTITL